LLNGEVIQNQKIKERSVKLKRFSSSLLILKLIYLPPKVCRALPEEGQFAMDGALSFVEQGCESKRPGNGADFSPLVKQV
jgi:hypothetical protein